MEEVIFAGLIFIPAVVKLIIAILVIVLLVKLIRKN
jgi:hypothetical protein